jgi:hypothetical protein
MIDAFALTVSFMGLIDRLNKLGDDLLELLAVEVD